MEVPAGWTPHGEPMAVRLKRPCSSCGYDGEVVTQAVVQRNARKMRTKCPQCGEKFELPIKDFGSAVGWVPSTTGIRRRGPAWQPRDHQLFARYNWCCVYHEGSAEAAAFRRDQLVALGITTPASALISPAQDSLFASARTLSQPVSVDPNLFGLVPDHVIPKVIQETLDDRWTSQQRDLMAREWIVAACGRCNGQRNQQLENVQQLLYIFSRYVLPYRPGDEIARLRETFLFVEILEAIEGYRAENGSEPLRPARLARADEMGTG